MVEYNYMTMNWRYIAGFFDGEGTIAHNGKGFRITIPQTNELVLQKIKLFVGSGNIIYIPKRKSHWSDSWVYYLARQSEVYKFLLRINPFLIVKNNAVKRVIPKLKIILDQQKSKRKTYFYRKQKGKKLRQKGLAYREIGRQLGIDWGYARRLILDIR
ncbi:MAG: LAGLIDADG family homing endonuclease [Candidatus Azambacteria bacterium]|nr:LAGLIDADG family homing endonuclease [Candidatus Azambacteria bacterium]